MTLNQILNPLTEMAYPAEFSMETLKKLPSYKKRLEYVQSLLPGKAGSGSSRVVFKVDDEKVLKVAKNQKGLAQNEAESDWGTQHYDICAKTFDRDEDGLFLEMELASRVTEKKFQQITGVSTVLLDQWLRYQGARQKGVRTFIELSDDQKDFLEENEWVQSLLNFTIDYGYPIPGDFSRLSSYGVVNRDGREAIVLIDFGLTDSVWRNHYKRG